MSAPTKSKLDDVIKSFKAQPVGSGYIDIIVSRSNYQAFAEALIVNGYEIEAISWWEYIESEKGKNTYGMGGPKSLYYKGWFSETCTEIDEIPPSKDALSTVIEIIENKVLGKYGEQVISYKNTQSLTPAFWLKANESWSNKN